MFFGAFLAPILLIILFNACIFVASSYVVIRLKVSQQKSKLVRKGSQKQPKLFHISFKDTCKLLALLAGFMFLLGLSWIILLFTVVGADTNIYAAFAIQWLFVFFNSLQGFFIFVFFVALNRDARNLWYNFLCFKTKKHAYSTRIKHSSMSSNTASTKVSTQENISSDTMKAAVKHNEEDNFVSTIKETDIDDAPDLMVDPIIHEDDEHEDDTIVKTLSMCTIHDIEKVEMVFN